MSPTSPFPITRLQIFFLLHSSFAKIAPYGWVVLFHPIIRGFNISLSKKETAVTVKLELAPINVFKEHHMQTDNRWGERPYAWKAHQAAAIIIFFFRRAVPPAHYLWGENHNDQRSIKWGHFSCHPTSPWLQLQPGKQWHGGKIIRRWIGQHPLSYPSTVGLWVHVGDKDCQDTRSLWLL